MRHEQQSSDRAFLLAISQTDSKPKGMEMAKAYGIDVIVGNNSPEICNRLLHTSLKE